MVADRNAAFSLAESSQRRLLLIETHTEVDMDLYWKGGRDINDNWNIYLLSS